MSFLDNIKLIASELVNMSPKTQLEIVKLCKNLCIEAKNYLVAFDETTLPALNEHLSQLDAHVVQLDTLYDNLSTELETAEGNISANANAIELLHGSVEAITEALSGIYTKSQVDTLLSAKANASDVYTKTQIDNLLMAKADASDVYTKSQVDTALSAKAGLASNNTFTGENDFSLRNIYLPNPYNNPNADIILIDENEDETAFTSVIQKKLYQYTGYLSLNITDNQYGSSISFVFDFLSDNNNLSDLEIYNLLKTRFTNGWMQTTYCGYENDPNNFTQYIGLAFDNIQLKLYCYDGYDFQESDIPLNVLDLDYITINYKKIIEL